MRTTITTHPMPLRTVLATAAAALTIAGCGGGSDTADPPIKPSTGNSATLKYFSGPQACAALEAHIEDTATAMMRNQLTNLRRFNPLAGGGVGGAEAGGTPAPINSSPPSAQATAADSASARFSNTNVQVNGVDELDNVKNDGQYLYTLKSALDQIVLTKAKLAPADAMRLVGQLRWPATQDNRSTFERPAGLFQVDANRLAALTSSENFYAFALSDPLPAGAQPAVGAAAPPSLCIKGRCGEPGGVWTPPRATLSLFDSAGDAAPAKTWSVTLAGRLVDARRIGAKIYAVTEAPLLMPPQVRWWPQFDQRNGTAPVTPTLAQWQAEIDQLIAANSAAIRDQSLAQWLSSVMLDGATPGEADCASFAQVDSPTRLGWLRVHTIDLDARSIKADTIMAEGATVYMAPSALMIATPQWSDIAVTDVAGPPSVPTAKTHLHRFAVGDDGQARYQASGSIDGTILNSYSIDEDGAGIVRLAATQFDVQNRFSYLTTLKVNGQKIETLGKTSPIAPGETLQSVRFIGNRAYLVTFRQIDPFFVYDLSDPANPTQLGELKIPGFSTYLHPIGDSHVLGIGYDGGGWPRRIKASLFDVRDPRNPIEQASLPLGDSYTASDALWDPHAFTFYSPTRSATDGVIAVPLLSYYSPAYGTDQFSAIKLIKVNPAAAGGALVDGGNLSISDQLADSTIAGGRFARRAVFIDDNVYAVADALVRSARIDAPAQPLSTLALP